MRKMVDELIEAGEVDCTEYGESLHQLGSLWQCVDCYSKEFKDALKAEIKKQHKHLKRHYKIVETKMTREYTVQELKDIE